jgi:transposase-like protein
MARNRSYKPEQIITKLRETEIHLGQGKTVKEASKLLEISEQTEHRWRREYGGADITQTKKNPERWIKRMSA